MRQFDISDVSEATKKQNPGLFPEYAPREPETAITPATDAPDAPECELQTQVEAWLEFKGYWRRTPKNIDAGPPPEGWFIHLHQAKGNPILLDLLIMTNSGQWYEVELKGTKTRVVKHQKQLIAQDASRRSLFYDFYSFREWFTAKTSEAPK